VTSQICGFWLDHVLRRGWSLLGTADDDENGTAGYENSGARIGWPSGAGADPPASSRRSV
jgi:hypothetical protein